MNTAGFPIAEFYVTYDRNCQHFLAVVIAPERPGSLQFSTREELHAAMDALGPDWQLCSEMQLPNEYASEISAAWLEKAAETKAFQRKPTCPDSIFSFGSIPW